MEKIMQEVQEYATQRPRFGLIMGSVDHHRVELVKHQKRAEAIMQKATAEWRDLNDREMRELDDIDARAREIEDLLSDQDPSYARQSGRRTAPNGIGNAPQYGASAA